MTFWEIISKNLGYVIILMAVIVFLVYKIIEALKEKKKAKSLDIAPQPPSGYEVFMPFGNFKNNLGEQKKQAIVKIKELEDAGKELALQDKEVDKYYSNQKSIINNRRQTLCYKYEAWSKHLKNLEQMIVNQRELDEKLKEGK